MKTYTKSDFHNPEQLTRQQVGEGYRLLLSGELPSAREFFDKIQLILDDDWVIANGDSITVSYRVPLATPLPDGTVLSSNECCWSDDGFNMTEAFSHSSKTEPSGTTVIPNLWGGTLKPRKVTYIAGSMSAHPDDFNFPAFYAAAESLEKQGYFPVNPAQLDIEAGYTLERIKQLAPDEFQEFLRGAAKRDLDALQQCDAIALLPGWESSKGAKAEKAVAEWLGLEIMYLPGALNFERLLKHGAKPYLEYSDDPLSEKAPQISDAKQPYNSDERAEWDVSGLMSKLQSSIAPDDPKGAAGALKAPMWLLPAHALQQTAWVHKLGSEKYGPYNWRKTSVCATTYISAIMRHLDAWRDGEDNDPESGISHIAHVAASCNILLDAQHCGKLNDDRAKLCQI